jgi:hypothetical protein
VGFWESAVDDWIRWRTDRLPITPLDQVADGTRVKITGRIDAGERPLTAPISGRSCTAWSVEVRDWPSWAKIAVDQQMQEFVIRDGSNRPALVRASRARVLFHIDASSWPAQPTEPILALLRRLGLKSGGYFGSPLTYRPYRYYEGALESGETITVVGLARLDVDPSGATGSYREPAMRVVFTGARKTPLWILDGPARWRLE